MSFKAKCGCLKHDELTNGQSFKIRPLSQRPYKKEYVEGLIRNGLLKSTSGHVCDVCITYSEKYLSTPNVNKKMKPDHVGIIIDDIKSNNISQSDLSKLAEVIGASQHDEICKEAKQVTNSYSVCFNSYDIKNELEQKNPVLVSFLKGATGIDDFSKLQQARLTAFAAAIDCILAASMIPVVTSLFFALHVTSFFLTGSKMLSNLLSSIFPSGSYSLLFKWLRNITEKKCECPTENDTITYFDNNQVLARNWRVRYNSKAMLSVITSVVHITPAIDSKIQKVPELSPSSWLYRNNFSSEDIGNLIDDFVKKCNADFNKYRDIYIERELDHSFNEHILGKDKIDLAIEKGNDPVFKNGSACNDYSFLQSKHPNKIPETKLGEPCLVNPCSYEAVESVLNHLTEITSVGNERHWTTIGCDGSPYLLAARLIEKNPELQHFLLEPGLGHFEINIVKAIFKLSWQVIMKTLAYINGYKSLRAQTACEKCCDHHKAWQLLMVFFEGTIKELIEPYVKTSIKNGTVPSVQEFYFWLSTVKNKNYLFLKDLVFTYIFAVKLFRYGVRNNHYEAIMCARVKFSNLFYGLNCTCYQEIEYRDLKSKCLAPTEVKKFMRETQSFSVTGNPVKGEGGDFVLEAKNRRIKMLLPPGLPNEERWIRSCRSFDYLNNIRHHFEDTIGIVEEENIYQPNFEKEVFFWRKYVRESEYLEEPEMCKTHKSISGEILDEGLVNFSEHCKGNKQLYFEEIKAGKKPGKGVKLTPIFITPNDRTKFRNIHNKTKKEIEELLLKSIHDIRNLGFNDEAEFLESEWTKVRKLTKDAYIVFYKTEVCAILDDATNNHCGGQHTHRFKKSFLSVIEGFCSFVFVCNKYHFHTPTSLSWVCHRFPFRSTNFFSAAFFL